MDTEPLLKDDHLSQLADEYNVAQFVSFSPSLNLRHARIRGFTAADSSPEIALEALFAVSPSVNVRVFSNPPLKGAPFHYGITRVQGVMEILQSCAAQGLHTIVNETVDIHDGGVSGVSLGGIVEFAPDDTPRAVEKPGVVRMSRELADELLGYVYGFAPDLPKRNDLRIEFSLHPSKVGYRQSNVVVWEREHIDYIELPWTLVWPNRFSQLLGDKAFGLIVAQTLGVPVPLTTVIGRRIPPFVFGRPTGTFETWLRTCPVVPRPGMYTTALGWRDPFVLMTQEDPSGEEIASVLSQRSVHAEFSGASYPNEDGDDHIEGVNGRGDLFMQGGQDRGVLPPQVREDVQNVLGQLRKTLGPVRTEWVHDGSTAWIVQLHVTNDFSRDGMIYPGNPPNWLEFDPLDGLDALRDLVSRAAIEGAGVVVTREVGTTSHVGDILRKARVPSRLSV